MLLIHLDSFFAEIMGTKSNRKCKNASQEIITETVYISIYILYRIVNITAWKWVCSLASCFPHCIHI